MPRALTAVFLFCLSLSDLRDTRAAATAARTAAPASPAALPRNTPPLVTPASAPPATTPAAPGPGETDEQAALPAPSSTAQNLYASARGDLLQIRMLLKNGRSQ